MGIVTWTIAGMISFVMVRFIERGRRHWAWELLLATASALVGGVAATAMDFGGWAVADPRSFAFSGLVSLLAIGLLRSRKHRASGRETES